MKRTLIFSFLMSSILIFNPTLVTKAELTNKTVALVPKKNIFVILKAKEPIGNVFIKGLQKAAKDYDVNLNIEMPQSYPPPGTDEQIALFLDALTKNPTAIIVAPYDIKAFSPFLTEAVESSIPIIGLSSDSASPMIKTLVGIDNYAAGELAAHKMAQLVGEKGTVGVITQYPTDSSSIGRADGFINTITQNYPNIKVIYSAEEAANPDIAKEITEKLILSNPNIKGIFATHQTPSEGVIRAVKDLDKVSQIKLIGFNAGKITTDAIKEGVMSGAILQDPIDQGYKAIQTAIKAAEGENLPTFIDSGFVWYDKSNIDNPEIKEILYE